MTKLTLLFALFANPALAHPGHFGFNGGHDHWALFAGIAILVLAGFVSLKRRL